jgi:hypothetical protein
MQMVINSKATKGNKPVTLPKFMPFDNGNQESTSFNDVTWGATTRARMDFVNCRLRPSSLNNIIQKAKAYMVGNQAGGSRSTMDPDSEDMVDLSDSDGECQWTLVICSASH